MLAGLIVVAKPSSPAFSGLGFVLGGLEVEVLGGDRCAPLARVEVGDAGLAPAALTQSMEDTIDDLWGGLRDRAVHQVFPHLLKILTEGV